MALPCGSAQVGDPPLALRQRFSLVEAVDQSIGQRTPDRFDWLAIGGRLLFGHVGYPLKVDIQLFTIRLDRTALALGPGCQ